MSNGTSKNRTVGKTLTTTNLDVYVTPIRYVAYIDSIIITNVASTSVTFSLDWYDSVSSAYYPVAGDIVLQPHSVLQITNAYMLQYGDSFRGKCSVNAAVTVAVRVREEYSVVL